MAGVGNPRGSRRGENNPNYTHGIVAVTGKRHRKHVYGRCSYLDLRSHEGQDALRVQAGLIDDQGGVNAITTARFIAIRELTQHYYLVSLIDHCISSYLIKNPGMKGSTKMLAKLFSYRAPVSNGIARYLDILGLDKRPPKVESLEEITAEMLKGKDDKPGDLDNTERQEPDASDGIDNTATDNGSEKR